MIRVCCPIIASLLVACAVRADDPPKQESKGAPETQAGQAVQPPDAAKPDEPKPADRPATRSSDAELLEALEKHLATEPEEQPLVRVGRRMRDVQGRLDKTDVGDETRLTQARIVQELDELIEAMKKGGG